MWRSPHDRRRRGRLLRPLTLQSLLLAGLALGVPAAAQEPESESVGRVPVPVVEPRPADVATLDGIVAAFYDVISGPAGEPRQWARDRTLYMPGARFVAMDVDEAGNPRARILDHQEFVDLVDAGMVAEGFFEREIHRATRRFGNIAHVFSTYEAKNRPDGTVLSRGINSLNLFYDGKRWWIASAVWDEERPENPIPAELLPPAER